MIDVNLKVSQYVGLRDARRALKAAFDKEDRELRELQDKVAGQLQEHMTATGIKSLRTDHGTCYTTTKDSAALADPNAFMAYVIEHNRFDLIDRRANVVAVRKFIEQNKTQPPGVNWSSRAEIGVRRAGAKGEDDED
jgi:hypothetical protein